MEFDPFAGPALARTAPSTESQREIWTAARLGDDASCAFNESCTLELRGRLDLAALRGALSDLLERHEATRTTLSPDGTTLCVAAELALPLTLVDLAEAARADREARVARLLQEEVERPFALETGPLVRFHLVRLSAGEHLLVFTAHHIVCDGFSIAVLVRDLAALYGARLRGIPAALPEAFPFSAYAAEVTAREGTADHAEDERFWVGRFSGSSLPVLDLPTDRPRPRVKTYASRRYDHTLPAELVAAVKRAGAKAGSSFFSTLLAALDVLLHRLTGAEELVVGIPSAGQPAAGHLTLVGHCVNTLPIRVGVDAAAPFTALLKAVQSAMLDAQDHQQYTFGSLLRLLPIPRDPSRLPLVSVLFNLDQGLAPEAIAFEGLEVSFRSNPRRFENFDLFVNAVELKGAVVMECQYNTDLLDDATVRRWFEALERILREVAVRPDLPVARIPMLPAGDERRIAAWNETSRAWPSDRLLHELVEAQVDRTPDAVAATFGEASLTFAELDRRANRLANALEALGAGPDVLVGLSLERSLEMVVALLAVHKAGAAYVPLDPAFPAERIALMVSDSGMPIIITQRSLRGALPPHAAAVIEVDGADAAAIAARPEARPARTARPHHLAYVLYTSGSTGKPKGVEVPISAVVNFLWGVKDEPGVGPGDRLLAVTTLSFDIAVLELWLPLVTGARIVLASRDQALDGAQLSALLERSGATVMQATPATWRLLVGAGWAGRPGFKVVCGGEALPAELAEQLATRGTVFNMYGPTETTVWSTMYRLPATPGPVLIGRPLANQQVYVLDALRQPVPLGVPGELWIGGEGVTRGYHARPELTEERFLPDPFRVAPGARMYRTGDVVRLRADGDLEFIGRNDGQVKVRGFRIELGDIEAALARQPGVAQAVAVAREVRPGDVRLLGYVVPSPGASLAEEALRDGVRAILPEYMVPQHVLSVRAFPLTPNGKIDRKALPAPDLGARREEGYVAPRDDAERLLAGLWGEALGLPRVGVHDDFFGLGGHSLLAAQVIARLAREHGISVPMRNMFEAPTIARFAPLLQRERPAMRIPRLPGDGPAPVSFMQERTWNLEQLQPGRAVFNLPAAFRLSGHLDATALQRAVDSFAARHEAVRTTLRGDSGGVVQAVAPELHLALDPVDLSGLAPATREAELMRLLLEVSAQPFDLERGPLVRARLYRLGEEEHVLFVLPHHAVWDGWSFDVLVRDLSELYAAEVERRPARLPALSIRYRDFSAWHREWLRSPEVEEQAEWWRQALAGEIAPLELPTDRPRPRAMGDAGHTLWVEIPRAQVDALTAIAQRSGATLFQAVLAAYAVVLHRWSGQADLLVGTPLRGRAQPETEDLIGTFINTLVLRTRLDGAPDFLELLGRVKAAVTGAFAHEDVPFELLAMSHKPAYRALFSFQDARNRPERFGPLGLSQLHVLPPVAANDVSLWVMEKQHGLVGGLNFSTELFDVATMERFLGSLRRVIAAVIADPGQRVSALPVVPEGEPEVLDGAPAVPPPVQALLEARAADAPAAPAVREGGRVLSAVELRDRARALAGQLRAAGVGPGVRVALPGRLSLEGVVGAAAVALAGGACLPLDPDEPEERRDRILAAARPAVALLAPGAPEVPGARAVALDLRAAGAFEAASAVPPESPAAVFAVPDGSGTPSLVEVPYRALAASLDGARRLAGLGYGDVLLATGSPAAGWGWIEPWLALASGGAVAVDPEAASDVEALRDGLGRSGATALHAPAWLWLRLLESGWSGGPGFRALVSEPAPAELAQALPARAGAAVALWGDAEVGLWCGGLRLDGPGDAGLLGAPLPGVTWRVADGACQPLPRGVRGELWVGGPTLSLGDGATLVPAGGARWRRTGQRARIRSDGRAEALGRVDDRLSVRGHRIEPAEVERALAAHPAVAAAAVAAHRDGLGELRLVAYVVRRPGQDFTESELRAHLRERVPEAAVPRRYVELGELPSEGGLPARAALPSPFREQEAATQVEARTPAERLLAGLWKEALALPRVGVHDNFFDLGGHSLLCLQVVAQIERRTGHRLSPKLLLLNTLEQVAAQLPGDGARVEA